MGLLLILTLVVVALVSLFWTPQDPHTINVAERLLPPLTGGHVLGTDRLGRDVSSILIAGSRNSLVVAVGSTIAGMMLGIPLGLTVASSRRSWRDTLSRLVDVGVAFPGILIALMLASVLGVGTQTVIIALVVGYVPWASRITIGPARQVLAREFVQAAFAYGRGRWFVAFRHVLPNIAPILIVQGTIMFAAAILAEAGLSFLGVGAQPPTQSWGRLLNESQPLVGDAPTLVLFPGLAITAAVLGFMLLGNGVHALLDPHSGNVDGSQEQVPTP